MRNTLLFLFLLAGQFARAQADQLVKVAGTKCSLVPPAGFVVASSFSGFQQQETGASIMINELPAPYQSIVDGFTADALKSRGMTLVSKETVDHNNSKATLIRVTQPGNGTTYIKLMLVFGNQQVTVLVNGIYPEASKAIEGKIREALFSTVYNSAQSEDPLDAAIFSVDVSGSEFKVVKYMSGTLLYSADGKIPTEKPTLIVGNSLAKVTPANRAAYAQERIRKLPRGEQNVIRETKEVTIDNLKGYEIIADGKSKDGRPELIYQVMLFNDKGDYFMILGQSKENLDQYIEVYRRVAKTFKRK